MKPVVNMLWAGRHMGPLHAACVRSFLRHDFKVVLHCYAAPEDAPPGVDMFDAARLLPRAALLANRRTGSVALGANRYRYKLIEAGMGLYVDCDMYCLRPGGAADDYVMGRQDDRTVNNAVLHYPPGSALSRGLLAATDDRYAIQGGMKRAKRLRLQARKLIGAPVSVEDMPWGVWGPTLLTRMVRKLDLWDRTAPIDAFYPVHPQSASLFRERGLRLADLTTPRTCFVHLWRQMLGDGPPPEGSPLCEILNA